MDGFAGRVYGHSCSKTPSNLLYVDPSISTTKFDYNLLNMINMATTWRFTNYYYIMQKIVRLEEFIHKSETLRWNDQKATNISSFCPLK